jgi:CRP-like cAMP-binding protein
MSALRTRAHPVENRLLGALSPQEQAHLLPLMHIVSLKRKQTIYLSGESMGSVYFPISTVLSLVSVMADGTNIEVGMVGSEGMAGLPEFLGARSEPFEMVVHVAGTGQCMSATCLSNEAHHSAPLRDLVLRYAQAFTAQVAQGTACLGHHSLRQRMAKCLLMIRDGIEADQFRMTHELLGQMLAVGRPRASLTAKSLRDDGLIGYRREIVTITDGQGLEATACECYRIVKDEHDRLLA